MPFDANSLLALMQPPALTVGDPPVTHTGRLISFVQAEPLRTAFRDAKGPEEMTAAVRAVCEAIAIPADVVLALPPWIMAQAVLDFFDDLYRDPSTGKSPTPPSGSASS